jgi:hypothetical protein
MKNASYSLIVFLLYTPLDNLSKLAIALSTPFRVAEQYSPLDLVVENSVFRHQVFISQQQFLGYGAGDISQLERGRPPSMHPTPKPLVGQDEVFP